MVAHQIRHHAVAAPHMGAVLQLRGQGGLEQPVESYGLAVVFVEAEPNLAQRLDDLVVDRPDRGQFRVGRQRAAATHGDLLDALRDTRTRVEHIAILVLPQAETELPRTVRRARHGAHLLGPGQVTGGHRGDGIGDLMIEAFIGGAERSDRIHPQDVTHSAGRREVAVPASGRRAIRKP